MKKYYFPLHLNSDNRGCEAIARGTINVLDLKPQEYVGLSSNLDIDNRLGLSAISSLISKPKVGIMSRVLNKGIRMIPQYRDKGIDGYYRKIYSEFLEHIGSEDICLITGGDLLCYGDNEINYIVEKLHKNKKKIILWGASLGLENLTPKKSEILHYFDCITVRESMTYALMTDELKLENVYLYADPAFSLTEEKIPLPNIYSNKTIGINVSNFVNKNIKDVSFYSALIEFIKYLLNNTCYNVILIPHVFWEGQDDRRICKYILDSVSSDDRVYLFNSEDYSYCQIRYAISCCHIFMGARTHSMISAYSTCTPSIAFGYSVKSRGIAHDLGLNEKLVLNYKSINNSKDIIDSYLYLIENYDSIKNTLKSKIPGTIDSSYKAKEVMNLI